MNINFADFSKVANFVRTIKNIAIKNITIISNVHFFMAQN
jgi:hypothetical protein